MNRPTVAALALLLLAAASSFAQTGNPWRELLPFPTASSLDGVTYGDGRFVAVGEVALTSDDGVVWAPHSLPGWVDLKGVVWSGGQFVAAGTDSQLGVVATSPDGVNWSVRIISACPLDDVAGDGQAVVVAGGGLRTGALVAFSPDGESWVGTNLPGAEYVSAVAWGNGRWIAVAGSTAWSSTDGIEWAAADLPELVRDLVWDGSRFVAVTCCAVLASSDGLSWKQIGTPPLRSPTFVAASHGQLLIDGERPDDADPLLRGWVAQSRDGASWSEPVGVPSLPRAAVRAEGEWVVVGFDGLVGTSPDGLSWRWGWQGLPAPVTQLAAHGDELVAGCSQSDSGTLLSNSGGVSWRQVDQVQSPIRDLVFAGNRWIAIGSETALQSADTMEWDCFFQCETPGSRTLWSVAASATAVVLVTSDGTRPYLSTLVDDRLTEVPIDPETWPRDLLWTGSRFVMVGDRTYGWSEDGISWTFGALDLSLTALAGHGSRLVAVGAQGAAAWSEDGETWNGVPTGTTADLVAVTWAGDRFVAAAKHGELVASPDGASWTAMEPFVGRLPSALAWTGEELIVGTNRGIVGRRLQAGETPPASAALRQLVPVAAHRSGIGGTDWRSDLHLTAASDDWAEVWLGLVAGDAGAPEWQRVALPPGGQLDRDDLVGRGFGLDNAAGPLLVASERPLAVTSRTFTGGAGGSYGQEIPAIPEEELAEGGTALVLPMLRQDGAFRTNLGVTNGGDEPIVVEIALFDAEGRALGTVDRELPPLGWEQVDGVLAEVGAAPLSDAYAVVSASPSTARFAAYASIVDAVTGDPTTITGLPAVAEALVVPAAGRGPGLAGTFWRSDLEVVNPGRDPAAYRIERLDGSAAVAFELAAGQAHRHTDVLAELGVNGTAALRVVPTAGEVAVASRTYTTGGGGGFGQGVPAVAESTIAGGRAVLPGLAESPRFRTNLGLVNPGDEDVAAVVELFRGDGSAAGAVRAPVPAGSLVTLVHAFGAGWVESGYAVVHGEPEGVPLLAWASVVDNATGDPVLVMGR